MRKQIIQVGGESLGIRFNKNEVNAYSLNLGDILDLSDVFKVSRKEQADEDISNILAKQNSEKKGKEILEALEG